MKRTMFTFILIFLTIIVSARQVESTHSGIAHASPGDYIIRADGNRYVLNQGDINYARKQLGLSENTNNQNRSVRTDAPSSDRTNVPSSKMNPFSTLVLIIIGIVIFVIWIEWIIGRAIGKRLSKETGTILGVVLIFLGIPIIIGIAIIIYSRGPKQVIII